MHAVQKLCCDTDLNATTNRAVSLQCSLLVRAIFLSSSFIYLLGPHNFCVQVWDIRHSFIHSNCLAEVDLTI